MPGPETLACLRAALEDVALPGEPRWFLALAGDGAAACGLVLGALRARVRGPRRDLFLSLVLLRAAEGDGAAAAVLALGRRRAFTEGAEAPSDPAASRAQEGAR